MSTIIHLPDNGRGQQQFWEPGTREMTRAEKVKYLQDLAEGKSRPDDDRIMFWQHYAENEYKGVVGGKLLILTEKQFQRFTKKFPGLHHVMYISDNDEKFALQSEPKAPQPPVRSEPEEPAPIQAQTEVIEDIPAIIETGEHEAAKSVKPSKIVSATGKTFNLKGEEVDRERAQKMDQFKSINNTLYE